MSRPFRASGLAVVLVFAAAGCQDYNFNPVGHCMLQPGSQSFTLSSVSSADVLFVVDDSNSMAGEQGRLADAFRDFVQNLTSTNVSRASTGLVPLDFHVTVTTTSVFKNGEPTGSDQYCSSTCGTAAGSLACCIGGTQPVYGPKPCGGPTDTICSTGTNGVPGTACRNTCDGYLGEYFCCSNGGNGTADSFPLASVTYPKGQLLRCQTEGQRCGSLETHYAWRGTCPAASAGVGIDQMVFPDGAFVGSTSVATVTANPRVLHFDKRLYQSADHRNAQGFTQAQLEVFFRQNVQVGTCGSLQEQGLLASRRALERSLSGQQRDTWTYNPAAGFDPASTATAQKRFTAPGGIPTPDATAYWPNGNSKLVLVYIGDEDDCSSPKDRSAGVLVLDRDYAGADACFRDAYTDPPLGHKETSVSSFVDYFTSLGRPVGAAFIVSATSPGNQSACTNDNCEAARCCDFTCTGGLTCGSDTCGGQAAGSRFIDAAHQLKQKGADVVVGSVCDNFGPLLDQVAEIVKPPRTLVLPTVPAESAITILRIADSSGSTRKICERPLEPKLPPGNYTIAQAEATGADWWFSEKADPGPPYFDPAGTATVAFPTKYVYINPKGACIANPGETYSADYLGVVPAGGCRTDLDCKEALGGLEKDWQCYTPPGLTTGTCTCRTGG